MAETDALFEAVSTTPVTLTPLLTRADLQRILRVSRKTLANMIVAGEVPAPLPIGKRGRWLQQDIDEYLAGLVSQQ